MCVCVCVCVCVYGWPGCLWGWGDTQISNYRLSFATQLDLNSHCSTTTLKKKCLDKYNRYNAGQQHEMASPIPWQVRPYALSNVSGQSNSSLSPNKLIKTALHCHVGPILKLLIIVLHNTMISSSSDC